MDTARLAKTLALFAAALAATGLIWAVLSPPKGEPLPAGAYSAPEGFAVLPPSGWTLAAPPPAEGDFQLLARLRPADGSPGAAGVAMTPRYAPDPDPVELLPFIHSVLEGEAGTLRVERVGPGEVDHLPSLSASGTGVRGEQELAFVVHVVRAADKTFIAGVAAPKGTAQEAFLSSVRVLDRPYSPRHLFRTAKGEVRKETLFVMLGLVLACYKWVFVGLFKER